MYGILRMDTHIHSNVVLSNIIIFKLSSNASILKYLCLYASSSLWLRTDRNALRSTTEVGFWPVEKAEHQGCCGRIPPESGRNRNPALDSGTPTNRNEIRNVQPRLAAARLCRPSPATVHSPLALVASHFLTLPQLSHGWLVVGCILRPPLSAAQFPHHLLVRSSTLLSPRLVFGFHPVWYIVLPDCSVFFLL